MKKCGAFAASPATISMWSEPNFQFAYRSCRRPAAVPVMLGPDKFLDGLFTGFLNISAQGRFANLAAFKHIVVLWNTTIRQFEGVPVGIEHAFSSFAMAASTGAWVVVYKNKVGPLTAGCYHRIVGVKPAINMKRAGRPLFPSAKHMVNFMGFENIELCAPGFARNISDDQPECGRSSHCAISLASALAMFIFRRWRIGPFTIMTGLAPKSCHDAWILNSSVHTASTAARTTGELRSATSHDSVGNFFDGDLRHVWRHGGDDVLRIETCTLQHAGTL